MPKSSVSRRPYVPRRQRLTSLNCFWKQMAAEDGSQLTSSSRFIVISILRRACTACHLHVRPIDGLFAMLGAARVATVPDMQESFVGSASTGHGMDDILHSFVGRMSRFTASQTTDLSTALDLRSHEGSACSITTLAHEAPGHSRRVRSMACRRVEAVHPDLLALRSTLGVVGNSIVSLSPLTPPCRSL